MTEQELKEQQRRYKAMYPQAFIDTLRAGVGDGTGIDPEIYQFIQDRFLTPKYENRNIFNPDEWSDRQRKNYYNTIDYLSSVDPKELNTYFKTYFNKPLTGFQMGMIKNAPKGTRGNLSTSTMMQLLFDKEHNFEKGGSVNYLKMFDGGGKTDDSELTAVPYSTQDIIERPDRIKDASDFYALDVQPRAEKYRNAVDKFLYHAPQFDPNLIIEDNFMPNSLAAYYKRSNNRIYAPTSSPSSTYVHEMAHADQFKNALLHPVTGLAKAALFSGGTYTRIPISELSKVDTAYPSAPRFSDSPWVRNAAKEVTEKHASNRELRYNIWSDLRDELGRQPTMEELDAKINSMSLGDFVKYVSNGYLENYFGNMLDADMDTDDSDNSILAALKKALIEVASNNQPQSDQNTAWAKQGMKFNYTKYFK